MFAGPGRRARRQRATATGVVGPSVTGRAANSSRAASISSMWAYAHVRRVWTASARPLRLLRAAGSLPGRDVLITGASGGVGHLLVELAAAQGARITAI